jgi:pimeloyl-ACP methyl ester carboxylesterase
MSGSQGAARFAADVSVRSGAAALVEGAEQRMVALPTGQLAVVTAPAAAPGLPPALYVHGLGGSTGNWAQLWPLLADVVAADAVDLPGFGWSPPPDDGDLSVPGLARAIIAYLDRAGRGPVHLFGNSLGGAVATRLAALRPDLVRSLTLISPALPELPPQVSALPTGLLGLPGMMPLLARLTRNRPVEQRTEELLRLCYGDPSRVPAERRAEAVAEYERRLGLPYASDVLARTARGIVRAYTGLGREGLWRLAEQVSAPVLLVYGLRDKLVSYRMARRAGAAFRDSRLLVLPESGHVAMMEHPEAVARGFRDFLAEIG